MVNSLKFKGDVNGVKYFHINIDKTEVQSFITYSDDRILSGNVSKFEQDKIDTYNDSSEYIRNLKDNKFQRDSNKYHITTLNVMEVNKLTKSIKSDLVKRLVRSNKFLFKSFILIKKGVVIPNTIRDISMIGLGVGEDFKKGNVTYYIVIDSDKIDKLRSKLGLNKRDLHITIYFDKKDVFGVRKDISTIV